eukprot:4321236-Prymnesium_polylepis.1
MTAGRHDSLCGADGGGSLHELEEAAGSEERLLRVEPDVGERRETLLVECDVRVERGEAADGQVTGQHLVHPVAEHQHIAHLCEAELGEDHGGLRLHRHHHDLQEAIDPLGEAARLAQLGCIRLHRSHCAEHLDGLRVRLGHRRILHHAVEALHVARLAHHNPVDGGDERRHQR